MTFSKFVKLYEHYKNDYDFKLCRTTYKKIEEEASKQGQWIPD